MPLHELVYTIRQSILNLREHPEAMRDQAILMSLIFRGGKPHVNFDVTLDIGGFTDWVYFSSPIYLYWIIMRDCWATAQHGFQLAYRRLFFRAERVHCFGNGPHYQRELLRCGLFILFYSYFFPLKRRRRRHIDGGTDAQGLVGQPAAEGFDGVSTMGHERKRE